MRQVASAAITTPITVYDTLFSADTGCFVQGGIVVTDAAIAGVMFVTFRWTERGVPRTHTQSVILTALGNRETFHFAADMDVDTYLTVETSGVALSGAFEYVLFAGVTALQ